MNIFQNTYDQRLQDWYRLRNDIKDSTLQQQCIAIDQWWQKAPLVNHYLHPTSKRDWPGPWELLSENTYCLYARGLGMIYTLTILGIKDVDFVEATNDNSEDVVLVLVDRAKYIMNYWPDTVVNNLLDDFTIRKHIDISSIIKKIG
jgi:hypothetical protein